MAANSVLDGPDDVGRAMGAALERIADKWTFIAVDVLADGPVRFNALAAEMGGVSHRVLAVRLRALERDGLVMRIVSPAFPPRVIYELTPLGQTLVEPIRLLTGWVRDHIGEIAMLGSSAGSAKQ